jgi:LmbE family N-acetylglucosaminyl deacetylase
MRILYIFPHPDDESFGPARAMSKQLRQGHEVLLLTLTKGGATRLRHDFGYTIAEMGDVRYDEMLKVSAVLGLTGMNVLDLPDSGLKELDPREIERVVRDEIEKIKPEVVVTYAVHGISGFHDHLISHAVVKRVFVEMREISPYLRRLAFFTLTQEDAEQVEWHKLNSSKPEEIDCEIEVDQIDIERNTEALDCYASYQKTVEDSGIKNLLTNKVHFEFFQEDFNVWLTDIFDQLP